MTDLSGRVTLLEDAYTHLLQQLLLKPDVSTVSSQALVYNQEFDSLSTTSDNTRGRVSVIENKAINHSIEIANLKASIATGFLTGLVITGKFLKGSVTLTGQNSFSITSSGQTVIFNPGYLTRSFSIIDPQVSDIVTLLYNDSTVPLQFASIYSVVRGTSPQAYSALYVDTGRSSTGNFLTSIGSISNTTGAYVPSVSNYSVPTGQFLWFTVTGLQGTVSELFCKISLGS